MFLFVLRSIVDVLMMTVIFYYTWELISKTNAVHLIRAAALIAGVVAVIMLSNLSTLKWIVEKTGLAVLIIFAFAFQPEIRKIFLRLGQNFTIRATIQKLFHLKGKVNETKDFSEIMEGAITLSKMKKGMLIIFPRSATMINDVLESGVKLNADVSSALLITIFAHETPLHDGACIIKDNKILSAGCFLKKLSERDDIRKTFGTRHRAGLGLTETTDAVVLIVSEETGAISLAYDGVLKYGCTTDEIVRKLESLLSNENGGKVL